MPQESENNIREQLVESGLWLESDPRDPSVNYDAARDLNRRCEKRFGVELRRSFSGRSGSDTIFWGRNAIDQSVIELRGGEVLARSGNFPMTACKAAMELYRRFKLEGGV
jgi:hypothetical protein